MRSHIERDIFESHFGRLLLVDALAASFRTLSVRKNPDCAICGEKPSIKELIDYDRFCGMTTDLEDQLSVPETTVHDLLQRRQNGDNIFILDVRKPFENLIANLGADQLIPVEELEERLGEINARREQVLVVHCRSGIRSARAVRILLDAGYTNAVNLKGGILAWSEELDPTVPRY